MFLSFIESIGSIILGGLGSLLGGSGSLDSFGPESFLLVLSSLSRDQVLNSASLSGNSGLSSSGGSSQSVENALLGAGLISSTASGGELRDL